MKDLMGGVHQSIFLYFTVLLQYELFPSFIGDRAPFPPEVPREEPNGGEQNQPVENDVNKIQRSSVQEVDEGPNKARCPPVPLARQETESKVCFQDFPINGS